MSKNISKVLGILVTAVGIIVLFGWFMDISSLKSIIPSAPTMKVTTSIMFILSGLLMTALDTQKNSIARMFLPILSVGILIFSVTILFSAILGINTGIESLIIRERSGAIGTPVPGRPSIGTLVGFIVTAALGLYDGKKNKLVFRVLGALLVTLGSLALIGYLASIPALYYSDEGISTAMAIHTAMLFVILGIGALTLRMQASSVGDGSSVK